MAATWIAVAYPGLRFRQLCVLISRLPTSERSRRHSVRPGGVGTGRIKGFAPPTIRPVGVPRSYPESAHPMHGLNCPCGAGASAARLHRRRHTVLRRAYSLGDGSHDTAGSGESHHLRIERT